MGPGRGADEHEKTAHEGRSCWFVASCFGENALRINEENCSRPDTSCAMTTPILRKRTNYLSFISNLFFKLSINIAPNGAVINIATTAAVSTNVPQASPSDKAIAPIDAWTVAFGR